MTTTFQSNPHRNGLPPMLTYAEPPKPLATGSLDPRPTPSWIKDVDHLTLSLTGSRSANTHSPTKRVLVKTNQGQTTYQCPECGKVYKHLNCLTKHKWEHSEYWAETSKLSLSKHQQVQVMEAAQILMRMEASWREKDGERRLLYYSLNKD